MKRDKKEKGIVKDASNDGQNEEQQLAGSPSKKKSKQEQKVSGLNRGGGLWCLAAALSAISGERWLERRRRCSVTGKWRCLPGRISPGSWTWRGQPSYHR